MAEGVKQSIDIVWAGTAKSEGRTAPLWRQGDSWMGSLIHGSQTIDIGMVQEEDGVKRRSRYEDHVPPDLNVNCIVYVLEIAGELVVRGFGEEIQCRLPPGVKGCEQFIVTGAANSLCSQS
jgi:hypothetical protein